MLVERTTRYTLQGTHRTGWRTRNLGRDGVAAAQALLSAYLGRTLHRSTA